MSEPTYIYEVTFSTHIYLSAPLEFMPDEDERARVVAEHVAEALTRDPGNISLFHIERVEP